ncbi:MAG: YfhO family protein, partial [Alphaproteobacteria bacterium]|nr:YfhO family protein [Alphaproteobacteria bacterium]
DRGWHPGGGVVAALMFAFGGSATSRLKHTSEIISQSWVPVALWLTARTLDRAPSPSSWRDGTAAGAVIALLIIGRDQVALIGLYVLACYVAAWWLDGGGRLARIRATALPLAVCAMTAAVIAAVPVVLTALLAAASNRPVIGLEGAGRGSLHPALLLMLSVADLFGAADPKVTFWGPPSPGWDERMPATGLFLAQNVGQIYCGILAMILLPGTGVARGLLGAREIRFFAVMLGVVLLYALGWYTPAFRLMYDLMPGVDLFRRPADATFIAGLLLAVTAGYLVHRLLTASAVGPAARPWWSALEAALVAIPIAIAAEIAREAGRLDVAMVPIATAAAFAAAGVALIALVRRIAPVRPAAMAALLSAFTVFDLAWNNAPDESRALPPQRYAALAPDGSDETVALITARLGAAAAPAGRDRVELVGIGYHWPGVGLAHGFDHLFGHNPLRLRDFARATGVGDTVATPQQRTFAPLFPSYRSEMADLCGVRVIASGVPVETIDPSLQPGDLIFVGRTKDAYVYENPRALPRVMLVPQSRTVSFEALLRSGWPDGVDPRRTVLLEAPVPSPPPPPDAGAASGTARLLRYANTEVDVEADAPGGGFLLLTDVWHPWWRAEVDGRPAPILKADVLFRAVALEPGVHRVHFFFAPLAGAWQEIKQKAAEEIRMR